MQSFKCYQENICPPKDTLTIPSRISPLLGLVNLCPYVSSGLVHGTEGPEVFLDPSYMALTDRDTRGNDQEHEWA
jgi:hypothetical protein